MKVTKMISRKMAGGILLGFLAVAGIVTGSQGSVTVYAAVVRHVVMQKS